MSEKTIGVIGQKYEDRRTGKVGTLVHREEDNKRLAFLDESADPFYVSYTAFKSNWRKVVSDVTPENTEEETETETTTQILNSEDEKVKNFEFDLTSARPSKVDVNPDFSEVTVTIEDLIVFSAKKTEAGFRLSMLPDIFTYSDWHQSFFLKDIRFNVLDNNHRYIVIENVTASIGDILQYIKNAAIDFNTYGYND